MKPQDDLFAWRRQNQQDKDGPLAARMRPRNLEEFFGQGHIVGPGRLLRRAIQADQLSSLLLCGPPGSGKTTLAQIIAKTTSAHFTSINAVLAGVKDIREAVEQASRRLGEHGQRTILFVDEVHRFNKAQQDALLPWVEQGVVILVGATTENPYFEVNKALVSRSRVFQLRALEANDLRGVALQALKEPYRGYGKSEIEIDEDALEHLVNVANGDARSLLNALELAVETTSADEHGKKHIDLSIAEESIQQRALLYDKEGDAHFDTVSAFIKSVRGSDPDAALYWLARMERAGEDPRFLWRRLLILACEDIGLADPHAISVTESCAAAFDRVGMPEGRYMLAQATLYLANTKKSNTTMSYFDALASVEKEQQADIPAHLKDASRDGQGFGHGVGYLYPHAYREHWVAQTYLPQHLQGQLFYQPSDQGWEATIADDVARRREAQLAAFEEGSSLAPEEGWTTAPTNKKTERWLQRAASQAALGLAQQRDRMFSKLDLKRHHLVLDLHASSGLLTWEALRQTPEGGVFTWLPDEAQADRLTQQARALPLLQQPHLLSSPPEELPHVLDTLESGLLFDRIIGREPLSLFLEQQDPPNLSSAIQLWLPTYRALMQRLSPQGSILLTQRLPRLAQRLHRLLPAHAISKPLHRRWEEAEEALYTGHLHHFDHHDLAQLLLAHEIPLSIELDTLHYEMTLTPQRLQRWFPPTQSSDISDSYAKQLLAFLSPEEVATIHQAMLQHLQGRALVWNTAFAWLSFPEKKEK
ncbi:MAG: AAA family ATPase [Myxococcales bacterium]|nr:AAA family ATPase [Myxococcales bacterium]